MGFNDVGGYSKKREMPRKLKFKTVGLNMEAIAYLFAAWNIVVMCLYGADKRRAIKSKRRIKESALIVPAYVLGALGAVLGMIIFNHKTSKTKFRILIPLAVFENIAVIVLLLIKLWR